MLSRELANSAFVRATSVFEWRVRPDRLDATAAEFALGCWQTPRRKRRTGS